MGSASLSILNRLANCFVENSPDPITHAFDATICMNRPNVWLPAGLLAYLLLAGCAGHEPLPQLGYKGAGVLGSKPDIPTAVTLVAGQSVGHPLTSYALMPGGWAMPITSDPSATGDFNTEDQAAFVENLVRILTERGLIHRAAATEAPVVRLTVKFLKTEHFPEMQDYVLDVLVSAERGDASRDKIYHASTIEGVNLVARAFQHGIDGRRHAAELLLTAVVPDLEKWLAGGLDTHPAKNEIVVARPFVETAAGVAAFLRERYQRESTFWKDGIIVMVAQANARSATIELRWSGPDLPPFCVVDLYGDNQTTRMFVREKNPLLSAKCHVTEALQEYAAHISATAN